MTSTNISNAIETYLNEQEIISGVLAAMATSRANKFSGAAVVANAGVEVVEYSEKQFSGPAMGDDEWASL